MPDEPTDFTSRRNEQLAAEKRERLLREKANLTSVIELYEQDLPNMKAALSGPHDMSLEEELKKGIALMEANIPKMRARIEAIDQELAQG